MDKTELPLQDKVGLVTGAAGAIGYGVAEVLGENGCLLAVSDLPGERLDGLTKDLKEKFPGRCRIRGRRAKQHTKGKPQRSA